MDYKLAEWIAIMFLMLQWMKPCPLVATKNNYARGQLGHLSVHSRNRFTSKYKLASREDVSDGPFAFAGAI